MALNSGKILMRRGQEVNFDPSKMTPGEWAVSLDSKYVRMCFQPGVCVRMATYDAFEADMVQIQKILAECQTVEEAVQRIYEEIKDVAVDVERIETAASNALKSEQNALNSANSASQSANTAVNKASEASESANTASAKAEQATEGARIATEKSNEAAESAGNVRNMSDVSQSYAVGGTGTREGEDTDNAKYYNQQASDNADRAEEAAERASAVADVGVATTEKAGLVKPDGETIRVDPDGTIHADRGTTSYTDLENKPKINDVVLEGEKTLDELGIASKEALEETDNKLNIIIENAELRFKETASGEHIHLDDSADSKLVELAMYGKATQNGIPTPENPVDIEIAGSSGSVEVKSVGKNLIPYPHDYTYPITNDGITFNYDEETGYITANGTANVTNANYAVLNIQDRKDTKTPFYLPKGRYKASGCPSGGGSGKYAIAIGYTNTSGSYSAYGTDNGNGIEFEVTDETRPTQVQLIVYNGYTANNLTFKPMIRLASDTDNTWEPYKGKTATIPTENGFAGIPVDSGGNYTDQNVQQRICDEIVKYADGSGEYIKRVESAVFDGSSDESWIKSGIASNISYYISKTTSGSFNAGDGGLGLLCNRFQAFKTKDLVEKDTVGCSYGYEGRGELRIGLGLSSEVNTVDLFRTWLSNNPVEMVYQLKTPSRTPLTAEQLAEIEKLSTFYPVTNISNDADCGMKVKYIADAKSYIDNRLALIEQAMINSI